MIERQNYEMKSKNEVLKVRKSLNYEAKVKIKCLISSSHIITTGVFSLAAVSSSQVRPEWKNKNQFSG